MRQLSLVRSAGSPERASASESSSSVQAGFETVFEDPGDQTVLRASRLGMWLVPPPARRPGWKGHTLGHFGG